MTPPREIPWAAVMACFSGGYPIREPHAFVPRTFRPEDLQLRLDALFGPGPDVPADLYTHAWADETEMARYARETVVPALAALGVTVPDVPARNPVRARFYCGPEALPLYHQSSYLFQRSR